MAVGPLLHADADAFFASVVLRSRPELVAVPMAVVAHVFVASANYPARALGVTGGMLADDALRQHPGLVLVDVPRAEVEEAGDALFDLFHECARAVEPGSVEEAFLDVGASDWDAAVAAGHDLRRRAAAELGLPVSVGVGRTKLMAKLASRATKPDGLHVIGPEREAELRTALPLGEVWGVGAATRDRLANLGVQRLGDLDDVPRALLQQACGTAMARRLWRIRDGTDDATVRTVEARSVISAEGATSGYGRADLSTADLVASCAVRACRRAARAGLVAAGLVLTLRAEGGSPVVVKRSLAEATSSPEDVLPVARDLVATALADEVATVRVSLTGLLPAGLVQQTLF
ncbi:nucleotidyltransferase/DNA polymerase involved in DNA repair [Sanguibacter keddieii DSM 10542]|uniref:Nucleotidyltransferase/DNA polymerase involved in DNA repair n=1 Tax=Sanguibacter keddieii (strain ATCC 51767 / DSM 10542 / NCFB 3025 / ST-74) TaxID=446469 RepID=D1BE66_SANKS|nr:DNA repair nucleotidyltransferase/DNA polymerase [Sanguibacter keddieii]ACZ21144.1 nucleotidyltransferase/DNA polymerase involved in DNA repair [Sanguibacter keddieii DSM 10542]